MVDRRRLSAWLAVALISLAGSALRADVEPTGVRGLPFTRSYPLEEIGNVPRGARFTFDRFGRVAVVHDGFYTVLNDTVWIDLEGRTPGEPTMTNVVQADDGRAYYTAGGSWGFVEINPQGKLHPVPLTPADAPAWVRPTNFNEIQVVPGGVYFAGWNGVVYWDAATRTNRYFPITRLATLFRCGARTYASSFVGPIVEVDGPAGTVRPVEDSSFGDNAVEQATSLDASRALVATRDGRLFLFDGVRLSAWPEAGRIDFQGRINALQALPDGGIAVAVTGRGLYLLGPGGDVRSALTSSEYHRVTRLAAQEPGVLWAMGENAVEKILYGSPLSVFGQRLGLAASWPTVARWHSKILVASSGTLFEAVPSAVGAASRFQPVAAAPAEGTWAVTAAGEQLLVGNTTGVYAMSSRGEFIRAGADIDVVRLALVAPDLCLVIGRDQLTALRRTGERWAECVERVPAPGYTAIMLQTKNAVWLELGANRVARVAVRDGAVKVRMLDKFAWTNARWVNVGAVDNTIVLTTPEGGRMFFDDVAEQFTEAPALQRLLERSPEWLLRVRRDESGTLWATHERGVVTFTPQGADYRMDATTFELINEHFPLVQFLPGGDVWFATNQSLYHVERREAPETRTALRPILVSVVDGHTNEDLLHEPGPLRLSYARNDLALRFFAGSYAWRRSPAYEFRLPGGANWRTLATGSLLSFPGLREGSYHLEVRVAGLAHEGAEPVAFDFTIAPPWQRTWQAYATYGLLAGLAVAGLLRWSVHRAHRRTLELERLVTERTEQLRTAMQKLADETRNAATLAERDRLAGEIHDSLQQGLSGLMLQIDATLKLPGLGGDVRSRLATARNMVSFTRHEVQHAVWDLESPLLEHTELGEALHKLTGLIGPGAAQIEIDVEGAAQPLPPRVKHHLLRIAQEAITNAVRHAAARTISIRLEYRAAEVCLRVSDDGVGFRSDEALAAGVGHFGLRGLRGRGAKIGGAVRIASTPGQGTTIEIVAPMVPGQVRSSDAVISHA